jgi:hypothetical protein
MASIHENGLLLQRASNGEKTFMTIRPSSLTGTDVLFQAAYKQVPAEYRESLQSVLPESRLFILNLLQQGGLLFSDGSSLPYGVADLPNELQAVIANRYVVAIDRSWGTLLTCLSQRVSQTYKRYNLHGIDGTPQPAYVVQQSMFDAYIEAYKRKEARQQ